MENKQDFTEKCKKQEEENMKQKSKKTMCCTKKIQY